MKSKYGIIFRSTYGNLDYVFKEGTDLDYMEFMYNIHFLTMFQGGRFANTGAIWGQPVLNVAQEKIFMEIESGKRKLTESGLQGIVQALGPRDSRNKLMPYEELKRRQGRK